MTIRLSIVPALLLAVLGTAIPSRSEADSGGVFNLPQGVMKPKHGLQLVIDTRWVEGNGYLPVRVTALNWPPGPTVADRSIHIVLQPSSWQWGRGTVRVTEYVEIPEGATRGQTTVAVPHSDAWASVEVRVYENGRSLDDLSSWIGAGPGNYGGDSESIPTVLIVDADAPLRDDRDQFVLQRGSKPGTSATAVPPRRLPDVRHLVSLFPEPNRGGNMSGGSRLQAPGGDPVDDAATLLALRDTPRVELLRPSELPTRWIDFTSFDLVFVSFADLQGLAVKQPAAWQALRDWAASGPTLCVYDMALSDEQLAKLDAFLGLPDRTDATGVAGTAAPSNPWKAPDSKRAREEITALEVVRRSQYSAANDATPSPQIAGTEASPPPDSPPFVCRAFYRGRVVAIQADEPLAAGQYGVAWLLNELDSKSWMWYQRHGMSLFRENDDYWNWIVPGIGRAPVGTFLLLITAFVVVIGPVNYFFLRRRRRLYWLLVTVPVGAGAVTLVLFTYALISDGLGVRVRVRSFSEINQQAGQAVSWSRQSYYAGLAPSEGLKFPDRAAVFPLEQYPAERRGGRLGTYELVWSEGQNLVSGYLGARSTSQFLVVESGPSRRGLRIAADQGGGDPQVTNNLEATIDRVFVKDEAGRVLRAKELTIGQTRRLEPLDPAAASQELQSLLGVNQPAFPVGYDSQYYSGLGFRGRYYRGWSNVDQSLPPPAFLSGILERSIQATLRADVSAWPPRSYVAITHTSPGVSLGYSRVREEASFHVVYGTW